MTHQYPIIVSPPSDKELNRARAGHWTNDYGTGFRNPWPSCDGQLPRWGIIQFLNKHRVAQANDPDRANIANLVKTVKPTFTTSQPDKLKSTWLGHASFLLELPTPPGGDRGLTILCDPAFSSRCAPFQWGPGPAPRYTDPPCPVSELPEIDAIVISHNHYDHLDRNTFREVYTKYASRPPALFIGLNGGPAVSDIVPKEASLAALDWWEDRELNVPGRGRARITATPSQHSCARGPFDTDKSLWASWTVQSVTESGEVGASVWFAGDTGYCQVPDETHTIDPTLPVCPAFAEIGNRLGPFTLGLIPIGAYAPRRLFSKVHNAPIDAVRMFKDIQCKKAVAMHWGTWRMAMDRIAEAPEKLIEARKELGISEEDFGVCALGETRVYDP